MSAEQPVRIDKTAFVSKDAIIAGRYPVTIGARVVVHPRCVIRADGGPIEIGPNNVFEEEAELINQMRDVDDSGDHTMNIGSFNLFEVGSCNAFEPECLVDRGVVVPDCCSFGPRVHVEASNALEDASCVTIVHDDVQIVRKTELEVEKIQRGLVSRYLDAMLSPESSMRMSRHHTRHPLSPPDS